MTGSAATAPRVSDANLTSLVALSFLPSWSWRIVAEKLRAGEPPDGALDSVLAARGHSGRVRADELRARAIAAVAMGRASQLAPVIWRTSDYPPALDAIIDPPFVVWTRGTPGVLSSPAVAIVGSRAASPYALAVAAKLAGDLASRGVVIVSGLARGVDSAAHRGALEGGGLTVAVLGCGADVVYPAEHGPLARDVQGSGAVVSELAPGTAPRPMFFPLRNRIISGLSRAVVVVEAGEKSGSLITARSALEQGRDVLAVPGNVLSGRNRGAHALLRDGAKIVESADDILDELGWLGVGSCGGPDRAGVAHDCAQSGDGEGTLNALLECLPAGDEVDLDAISARSGLRPDLLLARLLELELAGRVKRVEGGRFVRS